MYVMSVKMRKSKKKPENKTLRSCLVEMQDYSIHYYASQLVPTSQEVIILVHGLAVCSRYMLPTAEHLAPFYQVLVPDLPGYGLSSKPSHNLTLPDFADMLARWMDCLGIEQAVLVGNSLGCQIIAQFALRYPERLMRAVLVGPTMDAHARTAHQQIGRWLVNLAFEPFSLYPIVLRDFFDIGVRRFIAVFRSGLRDRIEEYLPHMQVPTLVIRGTYDTIVPSGWAQEVTDKLPQGQFLAIEGAAHDVNYNSPARLAQAVQRFLNCQPGRPVKRPERPD
ncbi:alpha/beta hydrolase [Ktedonobacter sp. SOSP1-52]|nr:alpha/beta hydrolase [Ktedonobacter sp. SOSP1-52]